MSRRTLRRAVVVALMTSIGALASLSAQQANPAQPAASKPRVETAGAAEEKVSQTSHTLRLDGRDVTGLPLEQRRELLSYIVEEDQRLRLTTHIVGDGTLLFEAAKKQELAALDHDLARIRRPTGAIHRSGLRRPNAEPAAVLESAAEPAADLKSAPEPAAASTPPDSATRWVAAPCTSSGSCPDAAITARTMLW